MIALAFASLVAVQEPPARFDHPAKNVMVMEDSPGEVNRLCRLAARYRGKGNILACALTMKHVCVIIFPRGVTRTGPLYRHEQAHCNGWPATHPRT
jgi:hypothetical protein